MNYTSRIRACTQVFSVGEGPEFVHNHVLSVAGRPIFVHNGVLFVIGGPIFVCYGALPSPVGIYSSIAVCCPSPAVTYRI